MNQSTRQKNKASAWLILGCVCMSLMFSGCEKFLELPIKDKVPQEQLFTDQQGFIDALTGVYVGMDKPTNGGSQGLYTSNLSMGMLSVLANNYNNASTTTYKDGMYANAAKYDYASPVVRQEIDGIWGGMYNNIANINNLLAHIDGKRSVFYQDNFQRVKGEALALRALFHFDLARLFGQSPVTGMNQRAIPYITKFTAVSTPFVSLQAALDSCIHDLTKAKDLLAQTDTTAVTEGSLDLFKGFTQNHMNYWATKALLARVYLYKGDYVNAEKYAHEVIYSNKFPLATTNVIPANDRMFSKELLFSVYCEKLGLVSDGFFNPPSGTAFQLTIGAATNPAVGTKNAIYGTTAPLDWRLSWFQKNSGTPQVEVPAKYFYNTSVPYGMLQFNVPILRISEMYYIAAECAYHNGDLTGGLAFLNKVRAARGLGTNPLTNASALVSEIGKEYKKEFIQEGQTFFYYKRLNLNLQTESGTTSIIPTGVYALPIPDKENEFNQ